MFPERNILMVFLKIHFLITDILNGQKLIRESVLVVIIHQGARFVNWLQNILKKKEKV